MPADLPADEVDPDYLYFLQHVLPRGDFCGGSSPTALEHGNSGGERRGGSGPSRPGGRARRSRRLAVAAEEPPVEPPLFESIAGIDEDYLVFLRHIDVVSDRTVLKIGGHVVTYEGDDARSGGSGEAHGEKETEEDAASSDDGVGGEKEEEEMGIDSNEPAVIASQPKTWDWRADPTPRPKVDNEDDVLLHRSALRTPEAAKRETSYGYNAGSHVISGSEGVIWPAHINQRPDTDFKRRLIHVLCKPITRKEYIKLFDMASIRTPLVKLRQVRNDAKFYDTDDMGNSYFDHYPDLVKQVLNTSLPNGLALMRGFFFWLQNAAHEDQFRPWLDDSKDHEIIPLMD